MLELSRSSSRPAASRTASRSEMARLRRAAWAFTTRRVRTGPTGMTLDVAAPHAGDLVIGRAAMLQTVYRSGTNGSTVD